MSDTDEHLAAIRAGDADAFGRWVGTAEPALRESLRSFAAVVDTEAVLQESLLRVWQIAASFEPDGHPNALFRVALRIARNLAISERRRARYTPLADEDAVPAPPAPFVVPDPLLRRIIHDCKQKLPDKPRRALDARLAGVVGEPDSVLASRLEMTLNTFLQNVTRARRGLADCLRGSGVTLKEPT